MALNTDYVDDILDTDLNLKRKYVMIQNDDGTVSFEDVTAYTQTGSTFGAADVNGANTEINAIRTLLGSGNLDTISENVILAINELNDKLHDYIVDQGVSGIWTYRKWESGIVECWGSYVYTPTWGKVGEFYYYETPYVSLPFEINVKSTQVNAMSGGYLAFASRSGTVGTRTTINALLLQYYNDAVEDVRIAWHVMGTWK